MATGSAIPERILVVGNGFLGDTVLGIPFFRNMRRRFPRAVIDVLIEPGASAVLVQCPYKDSVLPWPRPPRTQRLLPSSLAAVLTRASWLRARGYTRAYLFKRSFSSALLVWLAGIPWRVGHAAECRNVLLSRAVRFRPGRHQAESYLDLLRIDGIDIDDGRTENWVSEHDGAAVDHLLAGAPAGRPRVFLAVCSTNPAKHWPTDRWAAVIDWLVADRGCEVFFCGGQADVATHAEIVGQLAPRIAAHVHDHSAAVPLRQFGAFASRMDLCAGIDSGLPHIAASHGVPVLVLFGPTDPNQWRPWSHASEIIRSERASMLDIGVDQVIASVSRLLRIGGMCGQAARPAAQPPATLVGV